MSKLMHSSMDEERKPLFEIYSYCPPNAFACIEHIRRDVAYRKQQHRSSYRLGFVEDWDELPEAGEGLDLLYFNRSFASTRGDVDNAQRLSDSHNLSSDAIGLSMERVMCQIDIGQVIMHNTFLNTQRPRLQYAIFSLDPAFQISRDADIVTVTNTLEGNIADIQYLVYALFLGHLRDTARTSLLESTATLFTAAIASHLTEKKTLTLKFSIPGSLSSITQPKPRSYPIEHKAGTQKFPLRLVPCTPSP
ncbi:hypothetical protein BJX96DRAFT_175500 [Aspergillus floccosus]